jgi:hypothetical protein
MVPGLSGTFFLKKNIVVMALKMINDELHKCGLPINKRKTHRLMDEISLLTSVTRVPSDKRVFHFLLSAGSSVRAGNIDLGQ